MIKRLLAGAALMALASTSFANTTGSLDGTDPIWDGCGSSTATGCFYDAIEFNVSATGSYSFTTFYPGDTTIDENLDGFLFIFEGIFDPADPGASIAADDDYSGDFGCTGANCSQIGSVDLTAGTSYFLVISSFTNAPTSFGQPTGPWEIVDASGAGDVKFKTAVVPVPAALWLMGSGLLGLAALRRRS